MDQLSTGCLSLSVYAPSHASPTFSDSHFPSLLHISRVLLHSQHKAVLHWICNIVLKSDLTLAFGLYVMLEALCPRLSSESGRSYEFAFAFDSKDRVIGKVAPTRMKQLRTYRNFES